MATTLTSRLVLELLDRVTGPARSVSRSILGINQAITTANGTRQTFGARLTDSIAANNAAMEQARGRMIDASIAAYGLAAAIRSPVRAAADFESAMADVRKVVDFPTPEAFTQFKDDLLAMSRTLPVGVNGLAEIAAAAGQAGIARDDILEFTEAAAKIGVAFDISAGEAGDAMAKMMTGLGITLPEAIKLTDAMNHLSNAQASSAAEILDVVRRVGAQAEMFGFTAEETSAFASAMISAGAESEVAATSFRNMGKALTRGASATDRQKEAFGALGLDAEKVSKAMQKDAVKTTIAVLEAISRLPEEQRAAISSDLFGDEARALGPLLTNLDLVRQSVGLVGDESKYAGSAFREFEVRSQTFQSNMERFNNVLTALKITIGNALIPGITALMESLIPIIDAIREFASAYPNLTANILAAVSALVAFRVALAGLTFLGLAGRGGALSLLALGMSTVGATAGRLWGAARATIALQAALAAMQGAQLTTFSTLAVGARGLLFAIPGVSLLASALTGLGAAIAAISAPVWATFAAIAVAIAAAGYTIYRYWDRITSVMAGVGRAVGEILTPAFERLRPVLEWLAPISNTIGAAWQGIKDAFAAVGGFISTLFSQEALSDADKAAYEQAGYDTVMAFWNGMKQVFSDLASWVKGQVDKVLAPILNAKNAVSGFFGYDGGAPFSEDFGTPPARAKGGPISRGNRYLVGENGPELITASRSGYVHPTGGGGGGGGSPTINMGGINVYAAPGMDERALGEMVARKVEDAAREALRGVYADTGLRAY